MSYIFNDDKSKRQILTFAGVASNVAPNSSVSKVINEAILNSVSPNRVHVLSVQQCVYPAGATNTYVQYGSAGTIAVNGRAYPFTEVEGWIPYDAEAVYPHANHIDVYLYNDTGQRMNIYYSVVVMLE